MSSVQLLDKTRKIGKQYAERFPSIVKVINKENGGHGDAVNSGLSHASGKYFKVVDSDDWVDEDSLMKLLEVIRGFVREGSEVDMIVSNYVYEKAGAARKKCIHYRNVLPQDKIFTWDEIGRFHLDQYILMHSVIYRTSMIKLSQMTLPKHTFYVDNIYVYYPLPHVRKIYYMDVDFYRYYIGREDQSVNERVLMSRIDQQIRVTKMVSECVDLEAVKRTYPKLAVYLCRNISVMLAISSVHLLLIGTDEAYRKREELWQEIRRMNPMLYYRLRFGTLSGFTYLPGKLGGLLTIGGYRAAKRIYQFQ